MQGLRSAQSSRDGSFRLNLLPPGFYKAKITHVAYRPLIIDSIQVRLGMTSDLGEVILEDKPYELDEIVVNDRRYLIDHNSTLNGGNFTKNEIETLPLQRNYQYIPLLLPQITTSFYGDKFSNSGTTGIENRYSIDGIEVTEPIWFSQGISLPYNFIKDIEILTGGYEAQYRSEIGDCVGK